MLTHGIPPDFRGGVPFHRGQPAHTQPMVQLPIIYPRTVRPTERSPRTQIRMLTAEALETMLYSCVTWSPCACHYDGCVTWSPCACHYGTLRRAHLRFLTRCIGWRKHNHRADHPISYLDTFIKTGSESIEATLRRRRMLFAGFVARMEDTRLPRSL